MHGFIYVMSNPAMPKLIKIGFTKNAVAIRKNQLYSTGVPSEFVVEFEAEVENCRIAERQIHAHLKHKRFNKEFFEMSAVEAISEILLLQLPITHHRIRPELDHKVQKTKKTIQDQEQEKLKLLQKERKANAEFMLAAAMREKTTNNIAKIVGWPIGIASAFFVAQIVPERLGLLGLLILSLTCGIITGLFTGVGASEIAAKIIEKNKPINPKAYDTKQHQPENIHQTATTDYNTPHKTHKTPRLTWWHWMLIIYLALLMLSALGIIK